MQVTETGLVAQYVISVAAVSMKRGPERQLLAVTDMTGKLFLLVRCK